MAKRIAKDKIEAAVSELDKVRKEWLKRPNVTAVDVGYKIEGNKLTDDLVLRVHVKRKVPVEALQSYELFTERGDRRQQGAFGIDVIEGDYAPAQAPAPMVAQAVNRRTRIDPLAGGLSVGHPNVTAGTLGAIVWDRTDCKVCILSNWHILCGSATCSTGDPIYQPGVADGGTASDTVAELKRFRLDRDVDAALAELTGARAWTRDILELNPIPGIESSRLGMNVVKSGRTTKVTEGIIDGVSNSVTLDYGGGTIQTLHDQIHIVPRPPWPAVDYEVSMGGDSGSVWINESTNKAVGLHFAGERSSSPTDENAIANRMEEVAKLLDFSFMPLYCKPRIDDRWRIILWRILCRRYPWLCRPMFRGLTTNPPIPGVPTSEQAPGAEAMMQADIESLLDEIMDELRRSGY
jgi:endonuclease G